MLGIHTSGHHGHDKSADLDSNCPGEAHSTNLNLQYHSKPRGLPVLTKSAAEVYHHVLLNSMHLGRIMTGKEGGLPGPNRAGWLGGRGRRLLMDQREGLWCLTEYPSWRQLLDIGLSNRMRCEGVQGQTFKPTIYFILSHVGIIELRHS